MTKLRHMHVFGTQWRFGAVTKSFHWLTLVLVIAAYVSSPGGSEHHVYLSAMDASRQLHETLGMAVFAITLLRMVWRSIDAVPEMPSLDPWMRRSAALVQLLLYALLLAIPLTAVAGAWLEGHPLTVLSMKPFAPLLPPSHEIGQMLANIHKFLGNAILWTAGLHAVAALFHHFWLHDGVLSTMLPGRPRAGCAQSADAITGRPPRKTAVALRG
jgi:cytochrome b561